MGHPKFSKKHYEKPSHPWEEERIKEERGIVHKYGLKNKQELWKANTTIRKIRQQARLLTAKTNTKQVSGEKELLLNRVVSLGIIEQGAALDEILNLNLEHILDRRLQTQVYVQGFSRTVKQARQLITHGHIAVNGTTVREPGTVVNDKLEKTIEYNYKSPLQSDMHPVRPAVQLDFDSDVQEKKAEVVKEAPAEKAKEEVKNE